MMIIDGHTLLGQVTGTHQLQGLHLRIVMVEFLHQNVKIVTDILIQKKGACLQDMMIESQHMTEVGLMRIIETEVQWAGLPQIITDESPAWNSERKQLEGIQMVMIAGTVGMDIQNTPQLVMILAPMARLFNALNMVEFVQPQLKDQNQPQTSIYKHMPYCSHIEKERAVLMISPFSKQNQYFSNHDNLEKITYHISFYLAHFCLLCVYRGTTCHINVTCKSMIVFIEKTQF